jgi:hypothetical protein
MLLALWSPKGGSGTSVLAAACALMLAREGGGARLADLGGDQPAIFGLGTEPDPGLADWLAAGVEAPPDALERLSVAAASGIVLVPRGAAERALAPVPAAEAGAALAVVLRDGPVPTVVDVGTPITAAGRALVEVADVSVLVIRSCYLALRRAVRSPLVERAAGVALFEEPNRSLGPRDVRDVLDLPVLARVPVRSSVARAVDAGVLATRMPEVLARSAGRLLEQLDLRGARDGLAR